MKIRLDFVTNSSSVSYIVSWSPEMAEFIRLKNNNFNGDIKKIKIYAALTQDLTENGEKISINENEIYVKKYGFMKQTDCLYDNSSKSPLDFSNLDKEILWAYIRGEYLVNARLSTEFKGFGSVQVPRDIDSFKKKFCDKILCSDCLRKSTIHCFKVTNG